MPRPYQRSWQRQTRHRGLQALPDIPELSDAEKLAFEKKALGFYMSSHPLSNHAALLQALATHRSPTWPWSPRRPRSSSAV